jgi:hypothetical protein
VDIRTIEITLRNAVARGALDEDDVDAAMDGMWNALATFMESQRIPLGETFQEKGSSMVAALQELNQASTEVIRDRADLAAGTGTVHGRSTDYRPAP